MLALNHRPLLPVYNRAKSPEFDGLRDLCTYVRCNVSVVKFSCYECYPYTTNHSQ